MKRLVIWMAYSVIATKLFGADREASATPPKGDSPEGTLKLRAATLAKAAFSELSSKLLAAITRSDLNDVLPHCLDKAIPITKGVAPRNGVGLSRVTHRARNPSNKASDADKEEMLHSLLQVPRLFQRRMSAEQPSCH